MARPNFPKDHTIRTPRLTIRAATPDDAPAIAAVLGDPLNNPHTPVGPESGLAATYLRRMVKWHEATAEGKSAFMVICLRGSSSSSAADLSDAHDEREGEGPLIGFGGFNGFRWSSTSTTPSLAQNDADDANLEADIGVHFDHKYWNQGLGREALTAQISYAFDVLGAYSVSMDTGVANEPFRGLVRRIGLGHTERQWQEGDGEHGQRDDWVYKIGRGDWEAVRGTWAA